MDLIKCLGVAFLQKDVCCILVPLAGVQKINHWSHKKGLPHVPWHRRIPEVQNPVYIHLLQGDEALEQCTQLPFLIKQFLNESVYCIRLYAMLHWCFSSLSQARGSYSKRSIFTSISSPKVTYFGWMFLDCRRTKVSIRCGIHSGWVSFGNLGFHSRLKFGVIGHLVKYWIRWML